MNIDHVLKKYIDRIISKYQAIEDYVSFEIFTFEELERGQTGYRVDSKGKSLITGEKGAWDSNWIVIGNDTVCGDPIIVDLGEEGYPVSSLMHGLESRNAGCYISNSTEAFANALNTIGLFIKKKTINNKVDKIFINELKDLIQKILQENKDCDFDLWQLFIQPLFHIAEKYENEFNDKIICLYKNG